MKKSLRYSINTLALYSGVATLCDLAWNQGWKHGLRLAVITLAAAIVTLANAFGVGLWEAVACTLFDSSARVAIQEFFAQYYSAEHLPGQIQAHLLAPTPGDDR